MKAAELDKILPEVWETREFDDVRSDTAMLDITRTQQTDKQRVASSLSPKRATRNRQELPRHNPCIHSGQDLQCSLCNRIETKIEKIFKKNQNGFRRNRFTTSQILTIRRIMEVVSVKKHEATLLFIDFSWTFDSIRRGKMEQILLACGLSKKKKKKPVVAIMMLYINTKVKVRLPDGDRLFRHCYRCAARRYINSILYYLSKTTGL